MDETDTVAVAGKRRGVALLDRMERLYLTLLRGAVLVVATLLLIWAAWLAASSTYRIARSTDSVTEKPVSVAASDIEPMDKGDAAKSAVDGPAVVSPDQQKFYQQYVGRYYNLYRTKFESFRRAEDKRLTRDEFDDNFVQSTKRMEQMALAPESFTQDKADLEALYATMQAAVDRPAVKAKLIKYKQAQRKAVVRQVRRTRTETRRGWDSYSTSCSNWYESPVGCAVNRQVSVPYTQTVRTTALPDGVVSHTRIFRSMQDRYFELLTERRSAAADDAAAEREAIAMGNIADWAGINVLIWVLGSFVVLMFFFVLIAIERHQRHRWQPDPA